jgi:hypothetical protein
MSQKASKVRHARAGRILPVLALSLLLAPLAGAAEKRGGYRGLDQRGPPVQRAVEPPRVLAEKSIDRIIQELEKKYRAKVVRRDEREERGRKILVLRLLSDKGEVSHVRVDAETGKEL